MNPYSREDEIFNVVRLNLSHKKSRSIMDKNSKDKCLNKYNNYISSVHLTRDALSTIFTGRIGISA